VFAIDAKDKLDVVFAGNQDKFETKLVSSEYLNNRRSIRLITVPNFCTTGQVVLVDIGHPQLACQALAFNAMMNLPTTVDDSQVSSAHMSVE
jgi:hypothetical protein